MISIIAILVASAYVIGLVCMLRSMKRSPEGYEDEFGFHEVRREAVVIESSDEFIADEKIAA